MHGNIHVDHSFMYHLSLSNNVLSCWTLLIGSSWVVHPPPPPPLTSLLQRQCLKSHFGSSELWADASLGAASSAIAALATQPVDTVKTRVMTKRYRSFTVVVQHPGALMCTGQSFVLSALSPCTAQTSVMYHSSRYHELSPIDYPGQYVSGWDDKPGPMH